MTTEIQDVESLLEQTQRILEILKKGEFVEGMELFYADDVRNEEPTGVITKEKQAVIENEKNIL